jgi:hypothetical protein
VITSLGEGGVAVIPANDGTYTFVAGASDNNPTSVVQIKHWISGDHVQLKALGSYSGVSKFEVKATFKAQ